VKRKGRGRVGVFRRPSDWTLECFERCIKKIKCTEVVPQFLEIAIAAVEVMGEHYKAIGTKLLKRSLIKGHSLWRHPPQHSLFCPREGWEASRDLYYF